MVTFKQTNIINKIIKKRQLAAHTRVYTSSTLYRFENQGIEINYKNCQHLFQLCDDQILLKTAQEHVTA